MINTVNKTISAAPYGYTNFRSNNEASLRLDFQPRLHTQPIMDVFEKSTSNGIISSQKTGRLIDTFIPENKIKSFAPATRENERNKTIEKEKEHIAKTVTKRTEESKRKLRAAGVSERDLYKYLTIDGHINSQGQRIIRGN